MKLISDEDMSEESDEEEGNSPSEQQNNVGEKNKNKEDLSEQPRKSAAQLMRDKKKQTALTLQW